MSCRKRPASRDAFSANFPKASEWVDPVSRRGFLKLMGASLGARRPPGCTKLPMSRSIRTSRSRRIVIPGKPVFFAYRASRSTDMRFRSW